MAACNLLDVSTQPYQATNKGQPLATRFECVTKGGVRVLTNKNKQQHVQAVTQQINLLSGPAECNLWCWLLLLSATAVTCHLQNKPTNGHSIVPLEST
jgi:hypothetical protein